MPKHSIVEYFADHSGYKCGYCKNPTSSFSQGMWAHSLNSQDYQRLIDRGWRRSGHYCYKPRMQKTCCPQYAIRCHAKSFRFSKSKKKVAKRMRQFLLSGGEGDIEVWKQRCKNRTASEVSSSPMDGLLVENSKNSETQHNLEEKPESSTTSVVKDIQKGTGPDPTKPPCRKAKEIRMERKLQKINDKDTSATSAPSSSKYTQPGNLESLLSHLSPDPNAVQKLEVKLVRVGTPEFEKSRKESLQLYQKYQCAIHNDTPSDCEEKQWQRFLVDSPLNFDSTGPGQGFGTFHNQYWLNGKLIAVGVADVLPLCISSVYLYYDPDYGFLSLGIYSALSEIALVKQLQAECPSLEYYYMGFYIHSCPKMRYKGAYDPSDLLCPEVYAWVPITKCCSTLDNSAYARLNVLNGGSPDEADDESSMSSVNGVMCLHRQQVMDYGTYKQSKRSIVMPCKNAKSKKEEEEQEDDKVRQYVSLVGKTCAKRMLLYRSHW